MNKNIIELDEGAWAKTLAQISGRVGKAFPDVLNRSVASVLFKAARLTPSAARGEIRRRFFSSNKMTPSAYAIYRSVSGDTTSNGEALEKLVRRWAARRVAAAGYLKSSWYAAVKPFLRFSKLSRTDGARFSRTPVSIGRPAKPKASWSAEAEVENRAVINNPTATPILESALRAAIAQETAQLKNQLEKLIAKDIAKIFK